MSGHRLGRLPALPPRDEASRVMAAPRAIHQMVILVISSPEIGPAVHPAGRAGSGTWDVPNVVVVG